MLKFNDDNLIWIDLEMTGLDPNSDLIIEIATIVTDKNLNILDKGPSIVIHQPDEAMQGMDEWCTNQHGNSGLTERVHNSSISVETAENLTIAFLRQYVSAHKSPMCGNSICQDRRFLARYMPMLEDYFHYRHIDVSTLKELTSRWAPEKKMVYSKESSHLAMDDIIDSIDELKHYRETILSI
ncbi:MAG: oligoribonuclease [Gammaproteobacteria bacterium]|nr:oligoribonuclease [Gammaproteobacteria bacterium]